MLVHCYSKGVHFPRYFLHECSLFGRHTLYKGRCEKVRTENANIFNFIFSVLVEQPCSEVCKTLASFAKTSFYIWDSADKVLHLVDRLKAMCKDIRVTVRGTMILSGGLTSVQNILDAYDWNHHMLDLGKLYP